MALLDNLGPFQPWGSTARSHKSNAWEKYFLFNNQAFPASTGFSSNLAPHINVEQEIFYSGNTVWWSSGQTIKKSFTTNYAVIHVCWARFEPGQPFQDLCVLHTGSLNHYLHLIFRPPCASIKLSLIF